MKPVQALRCCLEQGRIEAGVDEAGRGCIAGPVVAAAVILPTDYINPNIQDSKTIPATKRIQIANVIKAQALAYHIAFIGVEVIDRINILQATLEAMQTAVASLSPQPQHLLIDGNRYLPSFIPFTTVTKGDAIFQSIAAASILAKTARDAFMTELAHKFPEYGWDKNKGYPTKTHYLALNKFGISPFHRRSFNLGAQRSIKF